MFQMFNCCFSTPVHFLLYCLSIYGVYMAEKPLQRLPCQVFIVRILTTIPWLPCLLVKLLEMKLSSKLSYYYSNIHVEYYFFLCCIFFFRRQGSKITSSEFFILLLANPERIQIHPGIAELYPCGGVAVG